MIVCVIVRFFLATKIMYNSRKNKFIRLFLFFRFVSYLKMMIFSVKSLHFSRK